MWILAGKQSILAYNGKVKIKPELFQNFAFWFQNFTLLRWYAMTTNFPTSLLLPDYSFSLGLNIQCVEHYAVMVYSVLLVV